MRRQNSTVQYTNQPDKVSNGCAILAAHSKWNLCVCVCVCHRFDTSMPHEFPFIWPKCHRNSPITHFKFNRLITFADGIQIMIIHIFIDKVHFGLKRLNGVLRISAAKVNWNGDSDGCWSEIDIQQHFIAFKCWTAQNRFYIFICIY